MILPLEIMTSDPAKPVPKPETFRSHLPAIAAAGTVLAAVLGSLVGTAGTVAGMAIGSLVSGTCSWWAERGIRRPAAIAAARTGSRARAGQSGTGPAPREVRYWKGATNGPGSPSIGSSAKSADYLQSSPPTGQVRSTAAATALGPQWNRFGR